ncbi:MAG: hypothetical protein C5B54_03135 [Acidobacteria bacterium]|nr:MAG: hypothetical protein C5B54_03135 [Acidobacteriota bacterium]
MFRIKKVFENKETSIYKVEGKITDDNLGAWSEEILKLKQISNRDVVLDFCQTWFMSRQAIEALSHETPERFLFANCPMDMRNTLQSVGFSARVLE